MQLSLLRQVAKDVTLKSLVTSSVSNELVMDQQRSNFVHTEITLTDYIYCTVAVGLH